MQGSAARRPLHGSVHLFLIPLCISGWLVHQPAGRKGLVFVPGREFSMKRYYPLGARGPNQSSQKQQILALKGLGCCYPL